MAKGRPSPVHLGGPLGLAGVALLASAVGLVVVANDTPKGPRTTSGEEVATSRPESRPDPRPPVGAVGVEQVLPSAGSKVSSGSLAGKSAEVTFIVRLKGHPEIDTICRNYKRNPDMALASYQDLTAKFPVLRDFRLVGASYSGEINLAYQLPPGIEPTRGRIEDIRQLILSIDGVAYADPDFVAHPGEDTEK